MNYLDAMQWPAMAITVVAAYFVAASHLWKRHLGFWLFLVSNAAWVVWGVHTGAYALIVLQVCLAAMNIRGAVKASAAAKKSAAAEGGTSAEVEGDKHGGSRSDREAATAHR